MSTSESYPSAKPVQLFRSLDGLPETVQGAVLAIGNFDGVHLGHQQVIAQARAEAEKRGAPLGVMLFDPHPQQFFAPDAPPLPLDAPGYPRLFIGGFGRRLYARLAV